ncbi:protein adenylyltransferase SelO [Aliiroseovarius sp. F20344]|uniref:protein adenylyltransferase SelO n=1 Tax=Aliiroseovarius sp. F20344 TaxID=2926414 RepID=UPI001FF2A8A8|nr:YdiU family protein [Aliiroseovarius sp. F20344]MCK0141159.1 YdiU family protein [Aliiroseovarius sp. F20344]
MAKPPLQFDNSYARELEGFYVTVQGAQVPAPHVLRLNHPLAEELGLDADHFLTPEGAQELTGMRAPEGGTSIAMAYAGHQFGGFSPQLGDGRALLIGELIDLNGQRRDIHLKGSGKTPFSRGGDGKAVLGPVLREYLMGEAMHALGIPTTRALAASTTGEMVLRQNGPEQGAVLARVASSHLRVGTFQFFASRGDHARVRKLADYAIARHYPDATAADSPYLELFRQVQDRQANLIAEWVHVGFVHGVMNTDNMTISGETIDYGPCAFIDAYSPDAVFSSIDRQGRYAFGNQPNLAQWNLARFAETLVLLINPEDQDAAIAQLMEVLEAFPEQYQQHWLDGMRRKLGLFTERDEDLDLTNDLHALMQEAGSDYTQTFRALSRVADGDAEALKGILKVEGTMDWIARYQHRLGHDGKHDTRAAAMDAVNPIYIPRNHLVEEALAAASDGDMGPFDRLLEVLSTPFQLQEGADAYALPAPDGFGPYTTFCGT